MKNLIIICICFLTASCNLDQVESKYADYEEATKDGFFVKGWIPENIIRESMTEIYVRNNLDLNTCIFSFKLSQTDLDSIKINLVKTETEFKMPRRIKTPKWWFESASVFNERFYTIDTDTVFIAIDLETCIIYGWRN